MERQKLETLTKEQLIEICLQFNQVKEASLELKKRYEAREIVIQLYEALAKSDQKKIESLQQKVIRDDLTGCYTKEFFINQVQFRIDQSRRSQFSNAYIVFLDIDDFSLINSKQGHLKADKLLRDFGELLLSRVRKTDIVARFGGDEFACLLNVSLVGKELYFRPLLEICEVAQDLLGLTLSIGICPLRDSDDFEKSNRLMLQSKKGGKNRITWEDENGETQAFNIF